MNRWWPTLRSRYTAPSTVRATHCHTLNDQDAGVIINTTTPGGKAAPAGNQPTAMSRAAGISLTKSWSKELAEFNIRVNTICIGLIKERPTPEKMGRGARG